MKAWLARATASTTLRGEDGQNRITRWTHWFPPTPTVDTSEFQDADEPYPRHWRRFPRRWSAQSADDPIVREVLRDAMADLPDTWRDVIDRRDVQGLSIDDVSRELRITDAQQRNMLNRARAQLRRRLAEHLAEEHAR